jgi:hypothetical protein
MTIQYVKMDVILHCVPVDQMVDRDTHSRLKLQRTEREKKGGGWEVVTISYVKMAAICTISQLMSC